MPSTKKPRPKRRNKASAKKVADEPTLVLKGVRLLESATTLQIRGRQYPSKHAISVAVEGTRIDAKSEESLSERLVFRLSVNVDSKAEDNDESKMGILCRFEISYLSNKNPNDEELRSLSAAAAHLAWPYAREFVASMSTKMGGLPIVLPLAAIVPGQGLVLVPDQRIRVME